MNSGLPSLLDAIFGKKDLASVSLDEMYEVINEFPSFNAAHYLLSKKLKLENDQAYEKESMRTALYFNNVFWLQTLLDENNHLEQEAVFSSDPLPPVESVVLEEDIYSEQNDTVEPVAPVAEPAVEQFVYQENIPGRVTSFDELILKYNIEAIEPFVEPLADITIEPADKTAEEPAVETKQETPTEIKAEHTFEPPSEVLFQTDQRIKEIVPASASHPPEIFEEIVNEYGIFEEVLVRTSDLDLDAFDRPIDTIEYVPESVPAETQPKENEDIVENQIRHELFEKTVEQDYESFDRPTEIFVQEQMPEDLVASVEISEEPALPAPMENVSDQTDMPKVEFDNGINGQMPEDVMAPADTSEEPELPAPMENESDQTDMPAVEFDNGMNGQIPHIQNLIREQQKTTAPFDSKKAEAIVFAPYHMIDYFASQGIKLILEDNPPDNLGRQLKSFTDWLKVMKKIPAQPLSERTDEKEAERIRHFAAHSIEDRDILTESMAEVLAKQGMYENAIALYQKLSLIYPPKSAYFASRIEQLKASLP